jgi:hypothetical protein
MYAEEEEKLALLILKLVIFYRVHVRVGGSGVRLAAGVNRLQSRRLVLKSAARCWHDQFPRPVWRLPLEIRVVAHSAAAQLVQKLNKTRKKPSRTLTLDLAETTS